MGGAVDLLILTLATWRMASLLASEEGPFNLFGRLRHLLGVRYSAEGEPIPTNWLAQGVACTWCNSVWFGMGWAVLYYLWSHTVWLALPLALSAGAVVVERIAQE